ncbi:AMP-binding protein [Kocuria marina]|uniref:AMP-binding protein n=1 Tax=Kocuria marina TaxID=223184 RepID=UPI00119D0E37|nr:AMP-binding protein [Kocuria indica]
MAFRLLRELDAAYERFAEQDAVVWDSGSLSYRELETYIDATALAMKDAAGDHGESLRVAIHAERHPATLLAYLACIKNGWSFVPIPPGTPAERAAQIVNSSNSSLRLSQSNKGLELDMSRIHPACVDVPLVDDPIAWLPHTSGSTGVPKGVVVTQSNLGSFVEWCVGAFPLRVGQRVASLSPFHFDLATHDIYATLVQGGTLVLPDEVAETSPVRCLTFLQELHIERIYMVPTFLERLCRAATKRGVTFPQVDAVLFAGERLAASARPLLEATFPEADLWNLYGPIETNVVTCRKLTRGETHDSSDIGAALPYAILKVRQPDNTFRAVGRGELCVGGPSVSPGYLNQSGSNAERFVEIDDQTLFLTGDEVSLDDSGRVTLHGRLDNMVKIRGLRVELEEVESVIGADPAVRAVGVVPDPDEISLIAYVQLEEAASGVDDVKIRCHERLPTYMLPSKWVILPEMCTTPSGKVDRQTLRRVKTGLGL